jgi:hypothetical protein
LTVDSTTGPAVSHRVADVPIPLEVQRKVRELLQEKDRVAAIREVRRATDLPLDTSMDVVEAIRRGMELPTPADDD